MSKNQTGSASCKMQTDFPSRDRVVRELFALLSDENIGLVGGGVAPIDMPGGAWRIGVRAVRFFTTLVPSTQIQPVSYILSCIPDDDKPFELTPGFFDSTVQLIPSRNEDPVQTTAYDTYEELMEALRDKLSPQ